MKKHFSLVACSNTGNVNNSEQSITNSQQNNSYQGILIIEGEKYITAKTVDKKAYDIDRVIGTVKKKVKIGITPTEDFSSNILNEGVPIYSVKGKHDLFLAKVSENKYYVFAKPVK